MKKGLKILALALSAGFCFAGVAACKDKTDDITVYMPDGAPALALAKLMSEDTETDGVTYKVVSPTLIATKVTNKDGEKNADLCVMPITAASKLLGKGEDYKMLGAVTHGNLYLISKDGDTVTSENIVSLKGKTVGVLQINEVPGLTFKTVLNKYEIPYSEITNEGGRYEDKVNLQAITGPEAVGTVNADYFLLAEPAVSAQKGKGFEISGDLQSLYGGEQGYPQAVLVAKTELVEEKAEWLEGFAEKLAPAAKWLETASGAEIVECVSAHLDDPATATTLKAPLLSAEVTARCSVRFAYAQECKTEVSEFLTQMIAVNAKAAAIPADGFYWTKQGAQ